MKFMPPAIARKVAEQGFLASKHSPTILFGAGVVGMVGSTVLACRATLRLEELLEKTEHDLTVCKTMEHPDYSDRERKRDTAIIYSRAISGTIRMYAPALLVGAAGVACLTKSHNILKDRNLAITAAYAAVDGAFNRYRERVVDRYGEDVDRELVYESEEVQIIDGETGEIVSTTRVAGAPGSKYARFYAEWSSRNWSVDPEINLMFLRQAQNYLNDRLRIRGHLFLNEAYEQLGLSHTKEGSVVGWRWNKNSGDNCVDFGIWDEDPTGVINDFFRGQEDQILLDFNVDGLIYDKLDERDIGYGEIMGEER